MQVNVILFGLLKELAGSSNIVLENIADTQTLVAAMYKKFPAMVNKKFIIVVDRQVVTANTALKNTSTVAFMPPFSGG